MGGGGGTQTTKYEDERVGVDKRTYGELSQTGIQSQEQYDALVSGDKTGLNYNKTYDRYSLESGVDLDAAKADWENYTTERSEIATYNATEERRKAAPDSLTGTSGNVDYSLGIATDGEEEDDKLATTTTYDESSSTASTSQTLGIY